MRKSIRRILYLLCLLCVAPIVAQATEIKIQPFTIPGYTRGTAPKVRVYYSLTFTTSTGVVVSAGSPSGGVVFATYNTTLIGGVVSVPEMTIHSTRNGVDEVNSRVSFYLYDGNALLQPNPLGPYTSLAVPATITSGSGCSPQGTCCALFELRNINFTIPPPPPPQFYDAATVDRIIAAQLTGAPAGAMYILKSANGTLTNGFAMDTLGTGLVKNTAGTPSIAVSGSDFQAPISVTAPLTFSSNTVAIPAATSGVNGYLSSTDWSTFNSKQAALGFTAENLANKNATNGYAGLSSGKVASAQLTEVLALSGLSDVSGALGTGTTVPKGTLAGITTGQTLIWDGADFVPGSPGAVTSVALSVPTGLTITGSPVTSSGTLAITFTSGQTQNSVLATPDGSSGALSIRTLANGDLPVVNAAHGGSGLSSFTTYNILATGTTSTGSLQQISPDTSGKVLTSHGVGVLPSFDTPPASAAHDILGPSHNNTQTQAVFSRGDLLSAQGSGTATLGRLALGTTGLPVVSNGTDVVYGQITLTTAVSGILPIANGGTNATSANFSLNGIAYYDNTRIVTTATGGVGTLCLVSTAGAAPVWGACSGSAATDWFALSNPSGSLSLSMGANTTTFTQGVRADAADDWTFKDTTGNTGTGHLVTINTVGTSTLRPIMISAQGTANGVEMNTVGVLAPVGTGKIAPRAADIVGTLAYSQLALTGAVLNADLAGSIAYSKLSLTGAILSADLAGSIAYSKLSLTGAILNADLAGSIADTKLSTISTAGKVSDSALSANVPLINAANVFATTARSSGSSPYLTITAPADTNLTADTEAIGVRFIGGTRGHADGTTQAVQREFVVEKPTYTAAGTSVITDAATVAITGPPAVSGGNMTITRGHALWVQAGATTLGAQSTNFWIDSSPTAIINRFNDRIFVGGASTNDGKLTNGTSDWLETKIDGAVSNSQVAVLNTIGLIGFVSGSRTSDFGGVTAGTIGVFGYALNDSASNASSAYAGYDEAEMTATSIGAATHGREIEIVSKGTSPAVTPFSLAPTGLTEGLRIGSGASRSSVTAASNALSIIANGARFGKGIVFDALGLTGTDGTGSGSAEALSLARGHQVVWRNSGGVYSTLDSDFFKPVQGYKILTDNFVFRDTADTATRMALVTNTLALNVSTATITDTSAFFPQLNIVAVNSTAGAASYLLMDRSRAAVTAVSNGDQLGNIMFRGYSSGAYNNSSFFGAAVDAVPSGADVKSKIYFQTGGSALADRLTLAGNGDIVLGNAALATGATAGHFYIPSSAGAPTGVPTGYTGRVALQYDTTNNRLYVYNGAWKQVALAP